MIKYGSRLLISVYFLFSGINKLFFFTLFSSHLTRFLALPELAASALGGVIIAAELIFAVSLVAVNHRWILRGMALTICVPFIIYNAVIFFILNQRSCNCSYWMSGESLTSPLFSIAVLILTIFFTFVSTAGTTFMLRKAGVYRRVLIIWLLLIPILVLNLWIWSSYQTSDLAKLMDIRFEQIKAAEGSAIREITLYLNFTDSSHYNFIRFFSGALEAADVQITFYILGSADSNEIQRLESGSARCNLYVVSSNQAFPDTLNHVGIQIYENSSLVFRYDNLPEMTADLYSAVLEEILKMFPEKELCKDSKHSIEEYYQLIQGHREKDAGTEGRVKAFLIMDRKCIDCDSDLLAMLNNYFYDPSTAIFKTVYFMDEFEGEDQTTIAISPRELNSLGSFCKYPHKLLLLVFGAEDRVLIDIPENIAILDDAVYENLSNRGFEPY